MFVVPLDKNNVVRVAKSIYNQNQAGTLKPLPVKRGILFNPNTKLTAKEKITIVGRENGKVKVENTKNYIYEILEGWDYTSYGKITVRAVATFSAKNKKTVEKYWQEFKEYAAELNAAYYTPVKSKEAVKADLNSLSWAKPVDKPIQPVIKPAAAPETLKEPIQALIRPAALTIPVSESEHVITPESGADERILKLFSKALRLIEV